MGSISQDQEPPGNSGRFRIVGGDAVVALVTGLGTAGAGLLAPLLAVCGGRLGRRARRLGRALQLQHQLNQFVLAQTLEITAAHATKESAFNRPRKLSLHLDRLCPEPAASPDPVDRYRSHSKHTNPCESFVALREYFYSFRDW